MTSGQLRARVLAEWRGLPEIPFPKDTARGVGQLIAGVMDRLGLKDRLREEEVLRSWEEIVGDFVARHSAPQRLSGGVLTVRVLQPTLRYELDRVWKRDILAKLKTRFGPSTVREVKFIIG
jgi:predicted nucleic acid-binding Zn ribbon protein